jgi:hypothetical protein
MGTRQRGGRRRGRGARLGVQLGEGAPREWAEELDPAAPVAPYMWRCSSVLYVRESWKDEGERRRKRKGRKRKEKYGKFSKLKFFWKIKDNLWVGQKLFFTRKIYAKL